MVRKNKPLAVIKFNATDLLFGIFIGAAGLFGFERLWWFVKNL